MGIFDFFSQPSVANTGAGMLGAGATAGPGTAGVSPDLLSALVSGGGKAPASPGVSPTLLALLSGAGQIGAKLAPQNPWAQTGTVAAQMAQGPLADAARQQAVHDALTVLPPGGTTPTPSALGPVAPQQAATPAAPITAAPTTTSAPNTAPTFGATPSSFPTAPTSSATSEAFSPQMHMWLGGLTPESYHAAMQEADAAIQRADSVHAQVLENQRLNQAQQMEQQRMVLAQNQDKREAAASDRASLLAPLQLQNETAQAALNTKQAADFTPHAQMINDRIKESQAISSSADSSHLQMEKDFLDYQQAHGAKGLDALHLTPEQTINQVKEATAEVAVSRLKKIVPGNNSAIADMQNEFTDPYTHEVSKQYDLNKVLPQINDWLQSGQVPSETETKNADGTVTKGKTTLPLTNPQRANLVAVHNFITNKLNAQRDYITGKLNPQGIADEQITSVQDESSTPPPVLNPQTTATLARTPGVDNTPKGGSLLPSGVTTGQLPANIKLPPPGMKLEIKNAAGQVLYYIDSFGNKAP